MHELSHLPFSCTARSERPNQFLSEHSPARSPATHSYGMSCVQPSGAIHGQSGSPDGCLRSAAWTFFTSSSRETDASKHSQKSGSHCPSTGGVLCASSSAANSASSRRVRGSNSGMRIERRRAARRV